MKMTKLLASGVAASLAATSLAAVASAAEKTFDMGYTSANAWDVRGTTTCVVGETIGSSADQADTQWVGITFNSGVYSVNAGGKAYTTESSTAKNKDGWIHVIPGWKGSTPAALIVKGYKNNENGTKTAVTQRIAVTEKDWVVPTWNNSDANYAKAELWIPVLKDTVVSHKSDEFAPSYFDVIESVSLEASFQGETFSQALYTIMSDGKGDDDFKDAASKLIGNVVVANSKGGPAVKTYIKDITANDATFAGVKDGNIAANVIAYALAHGGYKVSTGGFTGLDVSGGFGLRVNYPFIEAHGTNGNNSHAIPKAGCHDNTHTLYRNDIQLLSDAGAYRAESNNGAQDGNQTYNEGRVGTNPKEFAGLASQVADFFNKQTNGKITFKFTTAAAASTDTWLYGGVPSTQVGLRNVLSNANANDFALYLNYNQTGSLEAVAELNPDDGTVTFDISDLLDALNGNTIGVVSNVYFGLTKGVAYDDKDNLGLKVESITFSTDEDEGNGDIEEDDDDDDDDDDEDDTTDDTDDDDDDDTDDDDDDDDDDDVPPSVSVDDDDDNQDVGGVVDSPVVTPGNDVNGNDVNPDTGVALAVVPAIVAAAAVVVSKKRK